MMMDVEMKTNIKDNESCSGTRSNFTPLQQKRRVQTSHYIHVSSLCPSMDLAAFGVGNSTMANEESSGGGDGGMSAAEEAGVEIRVADSLVVYRTVSWQKLFVIGSSDLSLALEEQNHQEHNYELEERDGKDDDDETIKAKTAPVGGTALAWSPDGRSIAVGLANGGILLYDVESNAVSGAAASGGAGLNSISDPHSSSVHYIPPPPPVLTTYPPSQFQQDTLQSLISLDTQTTNSFESTDTTSSNDCNDATTVDTKKKGRSSKHRPAPFSPAITRSMSAARRKRMMRMIGQTPTDHNQCNDVDDNIASSTLSSTTVKPDQNNHSSIPTTHTHINTLSNSATSQQTSWKQFHSHLGWKASSITAITWSRVVPNHKQWANTPQTRHQEEEQEEISWTYRRYYLDRSTHFLPPSAYNHSPTTFQHDSLLANEEYDDPTKNHHRPHAQTPLSLLCISTTASGLHLYLHGQYRILSVTSPPTLDNLSTSIVFSSDLSSILLSAQTFIPIPPSSSSSEKQQCHKNVLTLYSIPQLKTDRYNLQIITSSYTSIMTHLKTIQNGVKEASSSWSSSLRQLDVKFDQLSKLLQDYGVVSHHDDAPNDTNNTNHNTEDRKTLTTARRIRMELLNYILSGHSNRSGDTANAMDQFFTHPLMNDQLLQRLQRSLEANVAGVEGILKKTVLGPVKALVYDAGELHGLVLVLNSIRQREYVDDDDDNDHNYDHDDADDDKPSSVFMNDETSLQLCQASELLYQAVERCASHIVEIRFRLNAIMKWIRGTASQVKARGTAADSVQRDNAKKRRVNEKTLRKVAEFLSTPLVTSDEVDPISSYSFASTPAVSTVPKRGMTECVLGILLSDFFTKYKVLISCSSSTDFDDLLQQQNYYGNGMQNFSSSSSYDNRQSHGVGYSHDSYHQLIEQKIEASPSVKSTLTVSCKLAFDLFDEPRKVMSKSVKRTDITFEPLNDIVANTESDTYRSITAIHKRLGGLRKVSGHDVTNFRCFVPTISNSTDCSVSSTTTNFQSSNWILIAALRPATTNDCQMVQIVAIPTSSDGVPALGNCPSYYLTSFVMIPEQCQVCDIQFYGDDGNSTLTSATVQSTEEGRQALGLIIRRQSIPFGAIELEQAEEISEEIWMFNYDNLNYRAIQWSAIGKSSTYQPLVIHEFDKSRDTSTKLSPGEDPEGDEMSDKINIVRAKWRQLGSRMNPSVTMQGKNSNPLSSKLILCGPRGIGGVIFSNPNTVDLFDLEEDEDEDDGGDDEEDGDGDE